MSRTVNIDVFNALSKFESRLMSYNRVTGVRIHYFVNKAQILFLYTNVSFWYNFNLMLLFVIDKII